MTRVSLGIDETLQAYVHAVGVTETNALAGLRAATTGRAGAQMQVAPEQGQFMMLLAKLIGARHVIEIGTYTGYSVLWLAHGLPSDGHLIACDIDDTMPVIGRAYWQQDGLDHLIDLRIAPALETLDQLLHEDNGPGGYDLIFIDADKANYQTYYERGLSLIRPGGLIMIDNTLWGGKVADYNHDDNTTRAIRAFNDALAGDSRVETSLVPVGDGLTLARKL